jgi:hypothetical protein
VDAALVEARKAIFAQDNGLEWGTPVLYLRTVDGRIFDVESAPVPAPEGAGHGSAGHEGAGREGAGREGAGRKPPASRIPGAPRASTQTRRLRWAIGAGLVAVVVAALVAMPRLSTKSTDHLIAPGKAMGAWRLGQSVAAYALGAPSDRWKGLVEHGANTGKQYYTGYAYSGTSARPELNLHECLKDGKVFAIYVVRKVHLPPGTQVESLKLRTQDGIGIGSTEQELFTAYGRAGPDSTSRWSEQHGGTRVEVLNYSYAGLDVLLNAADRRIFGIAATTLDAWEACEKATFGG